jgi:hypothetical protein
MEDHDTHWSEWTARELRPIARWLTVDAPGTTRGTELRMVWSLPDVSAAAMLMTSQPASQPVSQPVSQG